MEYLFSSPAKQVKASAVREILKLTQGDSTISFAGGLPAEEFFPMAALREAFERVFNQGNKPMQYGLTEGYTPLREKICERLKVKKGIKASMDEIILTTGSQQAIDLLGKVMIDPGDVILVENPTYLAALQAFHFYKANIVAVNSDADGMDIEDLTGKIKQYQPKLVYITPTFSNPGGKVWSTERRLGALEACRAHSVLLIEDDPYGELQFDDNTSYPPIISLGEKIDDSPVVYLGTFSKTVVPALRTGWAIGDTRVIEAMKRAKQAADLHSSSMDQQALYQLMSHFDLDGHITAIREEYKKRMQLMVRLLTEQNWPHIHWNAPKGGMFLWVELPEEMSSETLLKQAIREGVAFVPGTEFFVGTPKLNTLRLNFSHTSPERMAVGVERFVRAINALQPTHI